eukprot:TRINITY_DN24909_c0_g1_i1.p1 TRINITY_DN24909_c0_g1~~TRINITY_DN24909_c0_g1_i1.p1  ORF type:complete len:252 (-),score=92.38 TRINITY_DN24909_c0_g1_i1:46-801(-)
MRLDASHTRLAKAKDHHTTLLQEVETLRRQQEEAAEAHQELSRSYEQVKTLFDDERSAYEESQQELEFLRHRLLRTRSTGAEEAPSDLGQLDHGADKEPEQKRVVVTSNGSTAGSAGDVLYQIDMIMRLLKRVSSGQDSQHGRVAARLEELRKEAAALFGRIQEAQQDAGDLLGIDFNRLAAVPRAAASAPAEESNRPKKNVKELHKEASQLREELKAGVLTGAGKSADELLAKIAGLKKDLAARHAAQSA